MRFVGRETELATLEARCDDLAAGQGGVVLIRGMPGSGKSALLAEFGERVAASRGANVSIVSCSPRAEEPFSAFRRVVRSIVEAEPDPPKKRTREYLGVASRALLELGPEFVALILPPAALVGGISRYLLQESGVVDLRKAGKDLGYHHSNRETFSDFVEFFRVVEGTTPRAVLIDDLHWADEASMALFGRLSAFLAQEVSLPLLLIGSYRSYEVTAGKDNPLRSILHEVHRTWGDVTIDLESHPETESCEFTRQLIDGFAPNALDERFAQSLCDSTAGNPLHVTEILEAMVDVGQLSANARGELVARTDLRWDHVPSRLEAALAERVDRLPSGAGNVLSAAAVQGVDFSADVVALALRREIDDVLPILTDDLDRSHGLVRDLGPSRIEPSVFEFQFRTPEYRGFAYRQLTDSTRALAHRRTAESLLEVYKGFEDEIVLEAAQHFAKAGQPRLAAPLYLCAASAAMDAEAYPDARSTAQDALESSDRIDPSVEAELQMIAGQALHVLGEYAEATPHLRRAFELGRSFDSRSLEARSEIWLGTNLWTRNEDDVASEHLASGLAKAQDFGSRELEYRAMWNLGVLASRRGDASRALAWYGRASRISRDLGLPSIDLLNNRAYVLSGLLGDLEGSHDLHAQSLAVAREAGNRSVEALCLSKLASSASRLGDQMTATELAEEGINVSRAIGNRRREALAHEALGDALFRLGDWRRAVSEYESAAAISDDLRGRHRSVIRIHTRLALSLALDDAPLGQVLPIASRAVRLQVDWRRDRVWNTVLSPSVVLAVVLAAAGEPQEALDTLEPSGQIVPSGEDPWWLRWQHALASTVRASLNRSRSERLEATQRIRLAVTDVSVPGVVNDARRLLTVLARVLGDDGFINDIISTLDSPPQRFSPARSIRTDTGYLNDLAARLSEALGRTRLEPYIRPLGGSRARSRTLEELERGHDPVFDYEPIPPSYEQPLIELLRDLDPVRSVWEELLYESAEDHLDLLVAVRSHDALQLITASGGAFGRPDSHLVREARSVLEGTVVDDADQARESVDAAVTAMRQALSDVGLTHWDVAVVENMGADVRVDFHGNTLQIRSNAPFTVESLKRHIVRAVGTHVFQAENGRRQPLTLLGMGLGRSAGTEVGLASYNEELVGVADPSVKRRYALHVLAADLALNHGFVRVFTELTAYATDEEAFEMTVGAKRGLTETSVPGGLIKNHVYLDGLMRVKDAVEVNPAAYNLLMAARAPLRLHPVLEPLQDLGILVEPRFMPTDFFG